MPSASGSASGAASGFEPPPAKLLDCHCSNGVPTKKFRSSKVCAMPSSAQRRKVYDPCALNDAVVERALEFPKVTGPGAMAVHVEMKGIGNPSSVTEPVRLSGEGGFVGATLPALTIGALFNGTTLNFVNVAVLGVTLFALSQ